jgi:hypothetical protein
MSSFYTASFAAPQTVSEDAGIEPGIVATLALTAQPAALTTRQDLIRKVKRSFLVLNLQMLIDFLNIIAQSRCIPRLVDGIFKAVCFSMHLIVYIRYCTYIMPIQSRNELIISNPACCT